MNHKRNLSGSPTQETQPHKMQNIGNRAAVSQMSIDDLSALLDAKLRSLATKEDIKGLLTEIQELRSENQQLKEQVKAINERCDALKNKVRKLEEKSTEKNLVLHLPKNDTNTNPETAAKILLGGLTGEGTDLAISNLNLLDSKGKFHDILVEVNSRHTANSLLRNAKKLKNTGAFIHRDYSLEQRRGRRLLYAARREIRRLNPKAQVMVKSFALFVSGKKINWVEDKGLICDGKDGLQVLESMFTNFNIGNVVTETSNGRAMPSVGQSSASYKTQTPIDMQDRSGVEQ